MVTTIYNTSLLVEKCGTSVDVKVYVKNMTEWRRRREGGGGGKEEGRTRLGFLCG